MARQINVRASLTPPLISVSKEDGVPDAFWVNAIAEWGSQGRDPRTTLEVPLERFLGRLDWLRPACIRYGVGIDWDERSAALIRTLRDESRALGLISSGVSPLSADDVAARLDGSRFSRALRPFQIRDLGHLLALQHGANFSVPGAGKTTVLYALYEAEHHRRRVDRLLVVAPISAFDSWVNEAPVCFGVPPQIAIFNDAVPPEAEVVLVNYQRLWSRYDEIARWAAAANTHCVLDEAHRMKRGRQGEWGRVCLDLSFVATRRDVLSGTPAPQHPSDLVSLFDFVWPNHGSRIIPARARTNPPPPDAGHLVAEAIRPLFVRTTKHELGLPRPVYQPMLVEMSPIQRDIYKALRNQYAGQFDLARADRATLARMGRVVMYLLEAVTNPALLMAGSDDDLDRIEFRHPPIEAPPGSPLRNLIEEYASYETPTKFEKLATLIHEHAEAGRKTLVWTNFVRNIATLERMLARYRPAVIHGGIPSQESQPMAPRTREDELARFRTDPDCLVMLANPAATSEGVSLHDVCHDAVYLDRTFNAGQYLQSVDRIHRLGLAPDVTTTITFLITRDSVDELVDDRVRSKAERLGGMLDDPDMVVMALPDDDDYGPAIDSAADLAALFAHLRGGGASPS